MLSFLPLPAVIVDLETTGGRADRDRITEIGIVEIAADASVSEWSTLVNPGCSIPPHIQWLTGISNDMVAAAPSFEDLAAELHARLAGKLFIAHNARFDYGFLRNEFGRRGRRYVTRPLCTVRLSRALYPEAPRHNLDALVERHGIVMENRHRALGDARAVFEFLRSAGREQGPERMAQVLAELRRRPALPPYLESNLDELPETPGVYFSTAKRTCCSTSARAGICRRACLRISPAAPAAARRCAWCSRCAASRGKKPPASSRHCCSRRAS